MTRWPGLGNLRAAVARIERGAAAARDGAVLPLGVAAIDAALGEGGLRRGALHEVSGPAAHGFTAVLAGRAARCGGTVLWCVASRKGGELYPPGLAMLGLDPARLLLVRSRNRVALLAAAEEGLHSSGLAMVVAEVARPPGMTAARRLQLAAETGGVTGLLLCPGASGTLFDKAAPARPPPRPPKGIDRVLRGGGGGSRSCLDKRGAARRHGAMAPSPAVSRWLVDHAPGGGGLRWRLRLLRCRGGGSGEWMVDWNEKTHRLTVAPPPRD